MLNTKRRRITVGMMKEFKAFALRGNVMDMAVGIVIGAAFAAIVASVVADVIMPPVGILLGGVDFTTLGVTLKEATPDAEAVVLKYGMFIQAVVNFLIIALAVFTVVKGINSLKKKEKAAPAPVPVPTNEEKLLAEIRDLLKKN
jgi:large conductance mechanosensitive channel